ncbi:hypothetical protein [Motilimonas pumila]|uniref:DUF3592 domain-containing protein n=1 Tax=Motilimonas pumila TaxID=2303987 RepID=A0A418YHS0_9GAMM|nr:hypothetical protein [Motilimonas pumila]RJG49877.1 hypothetical protein D1Z90_04320 [Motilimonas pumila]
MSDMNHFVPGHGSESNVARLMVLMSLFLIIVPGIIAINSARLHFGGIVTQSTVLEVNSVTFTDEATEETWVDQIPKVSFTAENGKEYQVDLLPYIKPPAVGDQVEIIYLGSDPTTALPNAFDRTPLYVCIFFIVIGLIIFMRAAKALRQRY